MSAHGKLLVKQHVNDLSEPMELTIYQVKAVLLSMANDESTKPITIQKFFSLFLIKKAIPIINTYTPPFIVRCSINKPGEVFKHISRCSYNPYVSSIPLQRCNYPEQQVFYAAVPSNAKQVTADMTALLETTMEHAKNKRISRQYMTLSRWKCKRPLSVFILPFSKKSCRQNHDFKSMNKDFKKILKEGVKGDREQYEYLKQFLEFISDIFCKRRTKSKYYKVSAAFYNAIMEVARDNELLVDGLIYPSANSRAEGMNIVLKKEVIDSNTIYSDLVVIYAMQRTPNNHKEIFFGDVSNGATPNKNGSFSFNYIT